MLADQRDEREDLTSSEDGSYASQESMLAEIKAQMEEIDKE